MSEIDVRDQIVESATKFFSKFGFYKTTMDEIARHIHKAKGVLYYYFKSKEELFNEVLRRELGTVKSELSKILAGEADSIVIMRAYTLARFKLLHKAVNYHETLKADFFEKYYFVKDVRDDFSDFERNQLSTLLQRGMDEGFFEITNVDSSVNILMMIMNGVEIPFFLQNKYPEYENTLDELASIIMVGLHSKK
ncbi:MAG: TetR/AcrR family transcriptional regulator [Mariniphaga sp.]